MAHDLARQLEAAYAALLFRVVGGPPPMTRMIDYPGDDADRVAPSYMVQFWREPGLVEITRIGPPSAAIVAVYFTADGPPADVDWIDRAGLAELARPPVSAAALAHEAALADEAGARADIEAERRAAEPATDAPDDINAGGPPGSW